MKNIIVALVALLMVPTGSFGTELEDQRFYASVDGSNGRMIRMISTTDLSAIEPIIKAFQGSHPDIAIAYDQAGSVSVFEFSKQAEPDDAHRYDIAMSSAMDLQIKLVNDGLARPHESPTTASLPRSMRWRDSVFGFTQEPAAIVYNPKLLPDGLPGTRFELLEFLRSNHGIMNGRLVTYDIRKSGLGYLFATQDSFRTETYWRLMEVFGNLTARLHRSTGAMLDEVADGRAAVAYNVIAGYAYARNQPDVLRVMLPADYVLVMIRSVLIPAHAGNPNVAGLFIDYLVSEKARGSVESAFDLDKSNRALSSAQARPIRMDPGLLVFLDKMKKGAFLKEWESALDTRAR